MKLRLLPALLLAVASCSRSPEKPPALPRADILATVGTAEITAADFTAYAAERRLTDTPEARAALLEEMIAEECLVQQALADGLDKTPAFRRAMRQFLTTRLEEQALPPLLAEADNISDADLDAACAEAAPRFTQPPASRYAMIRIAAGPDERPAAIARLEAAAEKFRALPADPARTGFGAVAAEYSDDADTRYQGGDLGWLTEKDLATRQSPDVARAAAALSPGQLSAPLDLPGGSVGLLLHTASRPATPPDPATLRARVRQELISTRRAAASTTFRHRARAAVPVQIHSAALEHLPLPAAPTPAPPAPPAAP